MSLMSNDDYARIFGEREPVGERGVVLRYMDPASKRVAEKRAANLACPTVINGSVDVMSTISGEHFTDKGAYYRHLRANDCEIVDKVPDAPVVDDKPAITPGDLKEAVDKTRAHLGMGAL